MRKLLVLGGMLVVLALAVIPSLYAQTVDSCFTYSCSGRTCTFDADCSLGAQGRYAWNFGDGTVRTTALTTTTYTYANAGTYQVILKVGVVPNFDLSSQNVTVP
jgi:PKD repeat protein